MSFIHTINIFFPSSLTLFNLWWYKRVGYTLEVPVSTFVRTRPAVISGSQSWSTQNEIAMLRQWKVERKLAALRGYARGFYQKDWDLSPLNRDKIWEVLTELGFDPGLPPLRH
jgi:hypothetical protein